MEKSYRGAIKLLNSRRRPNRPSSDATLVSKGKISWNQMPSVHGVPSLRGNPSLIGMREWLQLLGHSDTHLNGLNVIHVSGTKGKGSTCAFADSLLRAHKKRTGFPQKIGLYTSPHLIRIEERIRIDSKSISEDLFTKYVFEVWDCLSHHVAETGGHIKEMPRYLQLLALISFHTFIKEKVDVAIYETHHGGEYDATNFIQSPIATGISKIGMDHVDQLGPSIENIAWHKAGIFKPGRPAFSALQEPAAAVVLQGRAAEKGVTLQFVGVHTGLPVHSRVLKLEVQRANCSLALALVNTFLEQRAPDAYRSLKSQDILQGIEHFSWPGRFHQIVDGNFQWFLDGAHNELSGKVSAQWFAEVAAETQSMDSPCTRILIFSQISDQRDGAQVLQCVARSLQEYSIRVHHVILTTYSEGENTDMKLDKRTRAPKPVFPPDIQELYAGVWEKVDPIAKISYEPTIEDAVRLAKSIGERENGMQTLVTGSLYLVGGVLRLLKPDAPISLAHEEITG